MIIPVILSGGSGTRLWPLSREEFPKHLIPLVGQQTLLQKTIERLDGLQISAPIVVCNHAHRFMVAEQLQQLEIKPEAILLEPVGRNTAPAVAIAALRALKSDPKAMLLVLPADHVVTGKAKFQAAVKQGVPLAEQGRLVTFGVIPTEPHTGYGYIRRGQSVEHGAYEVASFKEKPDVKTAEQYLVTQEYLWNSGMFLLRADAFIKELKALAPDILAACRVAIDQAQADLDFVRLDEQAFAASPDISIDYAVMEKTKQAVVVPMQAKWSDVGTWGSLSAACSHNADGNVVRGDVITRGVSNSYLRAESRLLAAVGLDNHVVIETSDAVLVAPKGSADEVKDIVKELKASGREERLHHTKQYRPWGTHELLVSGEHFEVRRVVVKPGEVIAKQRHHLRSEHWVIVEGEAEVTLGEERYMLKTNQSCYVPAGEIHKIANTGKHLLIFIEVQVGTCIKSDDIERL